MNKYIIVKMFCQYCGNEIAKPSDFQDKESLREFFISGMCQKCQNSVFNFNNKIQED